MWEIHQFYVSYNTDKFNIFTTTKLLNLISTQKKLIHIPFLTEEKQETLFLTLNTLSSMFFGKIILLCEQTHSNKIVFIKEFDISMLPSIYLDNGNLIHYNIFPVADGIITTLNNACILIFTADCIPLFIYNPENMLYGLVHLGRKGIESGIITNLIDILSKNSNNLDQFRFIIGPHICSKYYIVEGKEYSMSYKVTTQLLKLGINETQIISSTFCTYQDTDLFYSYRRLKTNQRNLSCITPKN